MQIGALITSRPRSTTATRPVSSKADALLAFREFDALTDRLGNALLERGFAPGDRVGVLLPNGIDCLVAYYALAKSGLVRVSLNTRETAENHAFKLADSGSRGVIHDGVEGLTVEIAIGAARARRTHRVRARSAPCVVDRNLDAPYRLGYTGGTTGQSKAVTLTTRGELAELSAFLTDLVPDILAGDTFLHAAPIAHASGAFFLPSLVRGARSLVMAKFDPEEFVQLAARERADLTFLVPTMLAMMLEAPSIDERAIRPALHRLRRLADCARAACSGRRRGSGASSRRPMDRPKARWSSPACVRAITTASARADARSPSPRSQSSTRWIARLPPGERGEIVCRGPQTMAYYWNNPEATAAAFRNGWLHTGDVGYMDEDGFFYLVDRKNDMLISGGYNVYPREVEDVLLACEGVVEAAVIGLPDEKWGDRVYAVVCRPQGLVRRGRAGSRARAARQLQAAKERRNLAGTAEDLGQQDHAAGGARSGPREPRPRRQRSAGEGDAVVNETHLVLHGLAIKKHATPGSCRWHTRSRRE